MTDSAKRSWVLEFKRPMGALLPFEKEGYRLLVNDEADELSHGQRLSVVDRHTCALYHGHVFSVTDGYVNVELDRTKAVIPLDKDVPDMWGEDDFRERKSPMSDDGQFVAVTNAPPPVPSELFNALEASLEYRKLRKDVKHLRAEVKALIADNHEIHQQLKALLLQRSA